jgi:hypothetical protein
VEDRTRRAATLVVFLIAAGASIATSPAPPPTTDLVTNISSTFTLDARHPVAFQDLTIAIAATALPDDGSIHAIEGTIQATVPPGEAGGDSPVHVTVSPLDGGQETTVTSNPTTVRATVPMATACPPGRECRLVYRVTGGVASPRAEPITVTWTAMVAIHYLEGRQPPAALAPDLTATAPTAPDHGIFAATTTDTERLELGADLPVAVRTVRLRRPALVSPDEQPLTPARATLRVVLEPPEGRNPFDYLPAQATVVQVGAVEPLLQQQPWDMNRGDVFDPFTGCSATAACETTLAVVLRWKGGPTNEVVPLTWRLEAWLGSEGPPPDAPEAAILHLESVASTDLGAELPRLTKEISGTFQLTRDQPRADRDLLILLDGAAVDQDLVGLWAMPGYSRVHAEVRADGAVDPALQVRITLFPYDVGAWADPSGGVVDLGNPVLAYGCTDTGCRGEFELGAWIADHQLEALADRTVTIDWTIAVDVPLLAGQDDVSPDSLQLVPVARIGP